MNITPVQKPIKNYEPPVHVPTLETDRLILRAMRRDDAADFLTFAGDTDTAYWAGMEPLRSIEEAEMEIRWSTEFENDSGKDNVPSRCLAASRISPFPVNYP